MTLRHALTMIVIAASLSAGSMAAKAQSQYRSGSDSHIYVGGNYGVYKDRGGDFDEDDDFTELLVGIQANSFLGIEASYLNFGEFSGNIGSADVDGYDLALVGRLPLTDSFGLFAKGGLLFWEVDTKVAGIKRDYDGDDPFVGVGADFKVTDNLIVALEYDRYRIDLDDSNLPNPGGNWDGDMDTMKLGARLAF